MRHPNPTMNDKVSGTYHGFAFSGVVIYCRPHTMNGDIIYFVELDSPISVYGDERSDLCLEVDFDTLSSKYGDRIARA